MRLKLHNLYILLDYRKNFYLSCFFESSLGWMLLEQLSFSFHSYFIVNMHMGHPTTSQTEIAQKLDMDLITCKVIYCCLTLWKFSKFTVTFWSRRNENPVKTFRIYFYAKIVSGKNSILDVWRSCEYASITETDWCQWMQRRI